MLQGEQAPRGYRVFKAVQVAMVRGVYRDSKAWMVLRVPRVQRDVLDRKALKVSLVQSVQWAMPVLAGRQGLLAGRVPKESLALRQILVRQALQV